jgi:hypothetical protein
VELERENEQLRSQLAQAEVIKELLITENSIITQPLRKRTPPPP